MSVAKELKMNNRIRLREACRVTANKSRPESHQITRELTDSSMVVKNHPDDIKHFIEQLRFTLGPLCSKALDHIGGVQAIMNRLPPVHRGDNAYTYLCVYDFYKAFRDSKLFSVERALKRIQNFGVRKSGCNYTRMNARGHWTSAASPNRKAYTQSFCSEFNYNWKMILALGARLASDSNRTLDFKTNISHIPYIEARMVDGSDSKFIIKISSDFGIVTRRQLELFLENMLPGIFTWVRRDNEFFIEVKQLSKVQVPELTLEQKEAIQGSVDVDISKTSFVKSCVSETTPVEDHFYNEMEKHVNDMTLIIDGYDRQIDELEAKASKIRAQRSKLLKAMQELHK